MGSVVEPDKFEQDIVRIKKSLGLDSEESVIRLAVKLLDTAIVLSSKDVPKVRLFSMDRKREGIFELKSK